MCRREHFLHRLPFMIIFAMLAYSFAVLPPIVGFTRSTMYLSDNAASVDQIRHGEREYQQALDNCGEFYSCWHLLVRPIYEHNLNKRGEMAYLFVQVYLVRGYFQHQWRLQHLCQP